MNAPERLPEEKTFFPRGAIAFFILLLLLYAGIWFTLYWIMIKRS